VVAPLSTFGAPSVKRRNAVGISIVIAITDSPFRFNKSLQNLAKIPQHDMPSLQNHRRRVSNFPF
jgi:hypothetical protein